MCHHENDIPEERTSLVIYDVVREILNLLNMSIQQVTKLDWNTLSVQLDVHNVSNNKREIFEKFYDLVRTNEPSTSTFNA